MSCPDWRPGAGIEILRLRAELLARARDYFSDKGVLEVETPLLSASATVDPNLHSLAVTCETGRRYLHTSPEFPMKRLLAAGSGDIYQISKVFRAGESGRYHNPEFTLLEWYRTGLDYHQLMAEVDALIRGLARPWRALPESHYVEYGSLFAQVLGVDPHRAAHDELIEVARSGDLIHGGGPDLDRDAVLDLLFAERVVRSLAGDRLTFVYDFPAAQASLAQVRDGDPPVAERFEVLWGELELANGFSELTDAVEQARRFDREVALRRERGLAQLPVDRRLVEALHSGLPPCAGVALGIDRLVMRLARRSHIGEVLSFDWSRA